MHRLTRLAFVAASAALAASWAPARADASDLVGPESCRTCHAEAYRVWSQGAHARAADTLAAEQRQKPLCLHCHSRDEARSGAAQVIGVSCETCHGGGRYYQPETVMKDKDLAHLFGLVDLSAAPVAQAQCLACHGGETPSLKPFDVKEAMGRIDHWTADRAARKQRQSARTVRAPRTLLAAWLRGAR